MNIYKAAVYLRVSKSDGSQNEANQEPDCRRLCVARGWEPVFFTDQESGAKRRPEWDRLKLAVHRGEVQRVVVWALDRAGRDRLQLAQDWRDMLMRSVKLVSVREPWTEQDGPMQGLLVDVVAFFAEAERARLIERTKAGQARARAAGVHIGRRFMPADKVRLMEDAYHAGESSFLAAKRLGIAESTVRTYYRRFASKAAFNHYSGGNSARDAKQ